MALAETEIDENEHNRRDNKRVNFRKLLASSNENYVISKNTLNAVYAWFTCIKLSKYY